MGSKWRLAAYTVTHFCVDFSCFVLLFGSFAPAMPNLALVSVGFMCYNILAFGLQPLVGYLCDTKRRFPVAILGCILLLAGLGLHAFPWPALVAVALGNACFHVGGGIDSLADAQGKLARSGVFVASGAVGVSLGTLLGQSDVPTLLLPALAMMLSLVLCVAAWLPRACTGRGFAQDAGLVIQDKPGPRAGARTAALTPQPAPATSGHAPLYFGITATYSAWLVIALCAVSIVIRAWVGGEIPLPWCSTAFLRVLPGICSCLGKAAGGFLADCFGALRIGVGALVLSIPLLCFGAAYPATAALGLFLFNINMPITLCAVADRLPRNPGLAFGITTLALLCGTVPLFFFTLPAAARLPVTALAIAASALCLFFAVRNSGAPANRKAGAMAAADNSTAANG